ncbi:MAG: YceI family protein [Blastocatellia bacterium]
MEPLRAELFPAQTSWIVEPRYTTVEFKVRSLFFFTVKGGFTDFSGTIALDENDLRASSVEVAINAASIRTGRTGIKQRDRYLRSADFLDAGKHPEIRFASTQVERGRDRDMLRVTGTLTIKGRSREIVLDVLETDRSRSPRGDEIAYYTALAAIDRHDFGVSYGRGLIGRTVNVTVQVQALRNN